MRGPLALASTLAPDGPPLRRTRSERFDDLVLDAVERLEERWSKELENVEFAVEDVPADEVAAEDEPVPLARLHRAAGRRPARIVLYRWPIETRAPERSDLAELVHDVVVEQVADLLGLDPAEVDPRYGEAEDGPE